MKLLIHNILYFSCVHSTHIRFTNRRTCSHQTIVSCHLYSFRHMLLLQCWSNELRVLTRMSGRNRCNTATFEQSRSGLWHHCWWFLSVSNWRTNSYILAAITTTIVYGYMCLVERLMLEVGIWQNKRWTFSIFSVINSINVFLLFIYF